MYGTGAIKDKGYGCYVSRDLQNWAGPVQVFTPPEGHPGITNFWAPECHYYNGSFYLFATYFSGATGKKGVSVFKSNNPLGNFEEISKDVEGNIGHITPRDWNAIDGTLYVDPDGQSWMVFVRGEFDGTYDGNRNQMLIMQLSDDLTHAVSDPVKIFDCEDLPGYRQGDVERDWLRGVVDAPWLYRSKTGELLMIWSGFAENGYVVAVARSKNGTIKSEWEQLTPMLYERNLMNKFDGGHGMIFTDLKGRLMLSIHSPNNVPKETGTHNTPLFVEIDDQGFTLSQKQPSRQVVFE
jgi:beta-xylosidase